MKKYSDWEEIAYTEYYRDFIGLNDKQKVLLAYKKILELASENTFGDTFCLSKIMQSDQIDKVFALVIASDFNCKKFNAVKCYYSALAIEICKNIYARSIESYNRVLDNYSRLAQELHIDNSLDLAHLFSYMLWKGYYSVNKSHAYQSKCELGIPGLYSFDVIKGGGACLAYSELLKNFLLTCGKEAAMLSCRTPKYVDIDYVPDIVCHIKEGRLYSRDAISSIASKFVDNHAITFINDNGKTFLYDPTNLVALNIINEKIAQLVNGTSKFKISMLSTLYNMPDADPKELITQFFSGKQSENLTREEFIDTSIKVLETIKNNILLLDDAYDNIHSELLAIDEETKKIGGYSKTFMKLF